LSIGILSIGNNLEEPGQSLSNNFIYIMYNKYIKSIKVYLYIKYKIL